MRSLFALVPLLVGVWPAAIPAQPAPTSVATASSAAPAVGPKKRIAVMKFDAGGLTAAQGVDLGSGLAAQLTTALIDTGQFIVIERAELASILREQELGAQRLATPETTAQVGKLLGAQLLVRASVTEFEQKAGGGGLRIGVGIPGGTGALGAAVNTGVVGIDLRMIDTSTGQVVKALHAEGRIEDRGLSADVGSGNLRFGADGFEKTPLGRAAKAAIVDATQKLVAASRPLAWSGRVVESSGDQVFLNAGADAGLKAGDTFVVSAVVREITDPASGAVLGVIEDRLGEVRVVSVQPGYSIAQMNAPFATKRGDIVRPAAR